MNKKTLFIILAIIVLPVLTFWGLTFNKVPTNATEANGKPQIIKFSSTMCSECKEVEKVFKELMPKYENKILYTEIIVDNKNDMNNDLIKKYNVALVPTIIMLDSDGKQHIRIESALPKEEMEKYIKELK